MMKELNDRTVTASLLNENRDQEKKNRTVKTRNSAIAEGPRDALVSRNSATTKYPYRV